MDIKGLNLKLEATHQQKQDLINFYFQPVRNVKENQLLKSKRKELALIILEEVLPLTEGVSEPTLISIEKGKIEATQFKLNDTKTFTQIASRSEAVLVVGKFELGSNMDFVDSNEKHFYFEVPVDGFIYGEVEPFAIIQDAYSQRIKAA